jgi:hypothetical protein
VDTSPAANAVANAALSSSVSATRTARRASRLDMPVVHTRSADLDDTGPDLLRVRIHERISTANDPRSDVNRNH